MLNPSGLPQTSPNQRPPRPWLAALFSFLLPGLGQFYQGAAHRGALFMFLYLVLPFAILAGLAWAPAGTAAMVLVALTILSGWIIGLIAAVNSWRTARRWEPRGRLSGWLCLGILGVLHGTLWGLRTNPDLLDRLWLLPRTYYIPAENMSPTLKVGEYILTRSLGYRPQRGDVVVFTPPATYRGDGQVLVKRIVAVGGDTVEARDNRLWVCGKDCTRTATEIHDFGPVQVPQGELFMMGDNYGNSWDSRFWGSVPEGNVLSKVEVIVWSQEVDRVGQRL